MHVFRTLTSPASLGAGLAWALVCASGGGATPAYAGPQLKFPSATDLGLSETTTRSPWGGTLVENRDLRSGYRLVSSYDQLGTVQEMSEYTPGDRLIDRRTFGDRVFVHEEFSPGYRRIETVAPSAWGPEFEDIEIREYHDGVLIREETLPHLPLSVTNADLNPCPKELTTTEVEQVMSSWKDVNYTFAHDVGELHEAGIESTRFKLEGCQNYRNGKGEAQLARDLEDAINLGSRCLAGNSGVGDLGPRMRMEAARLRAYVKSKQTGRITCKPEMIPAKKIRIPVWGKQVQLSSAKPSDIAGANAQAITCGHEGAPGMIVNASNVDLRDVNARVKTYFHEMLHWLGYKHFDGARGGVDVPYLASQCCMANDQTSCDLLKATDAGACGLPRPNLTGGEGCPISSTSVDYLARFSAIMRDNDRPSIGVTTAWSAMFRTPTVAWSDGKSYVDASGLLKAAIVMHDDYRMGRAVLAWAAVGNVTHEVNGKKVFYDRAELEPKLRNGDINHSLGTDGNGQKLQQFAEHLGGMISNAMNGYGGDKIFRDHLAAFQAVRAEACAAMSSSDIEQLEDVSGALATKTPSPMPKALDCLVGFQKNPCSAAAKSCN